jgi:hypothetical protein
MKEASNLLGGEQIIRDEKLNGIEGKAGASK